MSFENAAMIVLAVGVLAYLTYTMLFPEKMK